MPIETKTEFCQRHGIPIQVEDHEHLFPDGASLYDFAGSVQLREPPDDPRQRLGLQRQYWTECLRRIEAQFSRIKAAVREHNPFLNWDDRVPIGPRPQGLDAVGLLEHLKSLAVEPTNRLREIESALAAIPVNAAQDERERRLRKALRKRELAAQAQQQRAMSLTL
jgi:hypothetical protein